MDTGRRYVFRLLGEQGRVVATRYHLTYQEIGRLAALVVPDAVMLRLVRETGGNLAGVLSPLEQALKGQGFTQFMVVPADVRAVELMPVDNAIVEPVDALYQQLQSTAQLLRDSLDALGDRPETEVLRHRIASQLARLG